MSIQQPTRTYAIVRPVHVSGVQWVNDAGQICTWTSDVGVYSSWLQGGYVDVPPGYMAIAGLAPTVIQSTRAISIPLGHISAIGLQPIANAGGKVVTPGLGSMAISGLQPRARRGWKVSWVKLTIPSP
jgi:hypothetical protein